MRAAAVALAVVLYLVLAAVEVRAQACLGPYNKWDQNVRLTFYESGH